MIKNVPREVQFTSTDAPLLILGQCTARSIFGLTENANEADTRNEYTEIVFRIECTAYDESMVSSSINE